MRLLVVSDTHAPRRWRSCPEPVARYARTADVILHAGDVCTPDVLDELSAYAPVYVVRGNNDGPGVAAWGAPDQLELTLDGVRVAMVHDSGPAKGRASRLRSRFPEADLVVFGHSHIPWVEEDEGVWIVNPGSPTDRRRQPHGTIGIIEIERGRVMDVRIVPVT